MHILPIILTIMIPVKEVITILIAPRERIRIIIITVGEAVENELATLEGVAVERKVEGSVVVLVPIATKRNHDVVLALRRTIVRVVEEEGSEEPKADRHHQLHQNLYLLLRRRFELMIDTHHIMTTPTATRIILHKVVKENIIVVLRACRHHLVRNSVKILWQIIPLILLTPMKMHIILLEEVLLVYLHLDQNEDDGHHPPPRRPITNKSNAAIVVRILVVMTVVVTVQTILDTGIGKGGIEDDEVEVSEKKNKDDYPSSSFVNNHKEYESRRRAARSNSPPNNNTSSKEHINDNNIAEWKVVSKKMNQSIDKGEHNNKYNTDHIRNAHLKNTTENGHDDDDFAISSEGGSVGALVVDTAADDIAAGSNKRRAQRNRKRKRRNNDNMNKSTSNNNNNNSLSNNSKGHPSRAEKRDKRSGKKRDKK